jgi:hypothetical protein
MENLYPNRDISFHTANFPNILKLCDNGDIYVKGKLVINDMEVVEGMRAFITGNKDSVCKTCSYRFSFRK